MRACFVILICVIVLSYSCDRNREVNNTQIYEVDLNKKINPFEGIFIKAEIIPLETKDSSLLVNMHRVFPVNNKLYIYDNWLQNLYVFDDEGRFKYRIGRKGNGPDEYLNMFDCIVDSNTDNVYFLNVYGSIKCYDLKGSFKNEISLPARPHYYSMSLMNDSCMAIWSCLEKEDGGVMVFNYQKEDSLLCDWHDDRMFDNQIHFPFFSYKNKIYFAAALRQNVYEVTNKGLKLSYKWNFGKDDIKDSSLEYFGDIEDPNERNNKIIHGIGGNYLPFILQKQQLNSTYAYISLRRKAGMRPPLTHVFYDKEKQKSFVFDNISDVCPMSYPLYFGDDYILTDIFFDEREKWKSILPASEYQKLESMKEDDNPCLLKLYFK